MGIISDALRRERRDWSALNELGVDRVIEDRLKDGYNVIFTDGSSLFVAREVTMTAGDPMIRLAEAVRAHRISERKRLDEESKAMIRERTDPLLSPDKVQAQILAMQAGLVSRESAAAALGIRSMDDFDKAIHARTVQAVEDSVWRALPYIQTTYGEEVKQAEGDKVVFRYACPQCGAWEATPHLPGFPCWLEAITLPDYSDPLTREPAMDAAQNIAEQVPEGDRIGWKAQFGVKALDANSYVHIDLGSIIP